MKKKTRDESKTKMTSFTIVAMLVFAILPFGSMSGDIQQDIELNLKMPDSIVRQGIIHGKVEFVFKGESNEIVALESIKVLYEDRILFEKTLSRELSGISDLWDEYQKTLIEYEIAKRTDDRNQMQISTEKIMNLQDEIFKGINIQIISVDLNELFGNEFNIKNKKTIVIQISYEYNKQRYTMSKGHTITVEDPLLKSEAPFMNTPEDIKLALVSASGAWYFGDLHVHTGYSTKYGYDRIPSTRDDCGLEAEAYYGYQIPELSNQAYNVGRRWLSFTDHSYCLDDTEWKNINSESNAHGYPYGLNVLMASEETSVDDEGAGYWDETLCGGGGRAAHLGSHGTSSRLGSWYWYCSPIYGSQTGINEVKNRGGLSIINHSKDYFWDWETENISGETGIEIWNGTYDTDQHNVDFWVRRLLRGDTQTYYDDYMQRFINSYIIFVLSKKR